MSEKSVNFIFSYSLRVLISHLPKFIGLDGFTTSNYCYIFYSVKAFGKKSDVLRTELLYQKENLVKDTSVTGVSFLRDENLKENCFFF